MIYIYDPMTGVTRGDLVSAQWPWQDTAGASTNSAADRLYTYVHVYIYITVYTHWQKKPYMHIYMYIYIYINT